jgi:hypothetical protein
MPRARARNRFTTHASLLLAGALGAAFSVALFVAPLALALPEGRVYELVSEPYKGGQGAIRIEAVPAGGDSVAYYSAGVFADAPAGPVNIDYVAHRSASGWSTLPEMPPASRLAQISDRDVSSTLDTTFALGKPGGNEEKANLQGTEEGFLLHSTGLSDTSAMWELAGDTWLTIGEERITLAYRGASPDLCHLFFQNISSASSRLLPEDAPNELYELNRGCHGEPVALRLVGVKNSNGVHGEPEPISGSACGGVDGEVAQVGIQGASPYGSPDAFHAVADGGNVVFFTACVGGVNNPQLFVRLAGSRTLEVSRPLEAARPFGGCEAAGVPGEVPCDSAQIRASSNFVGASEDGSTVFFTTTAPLVAGDTDTGNDLYMASIGCPEGIPGCAVSEREVTSLTQVSHDPNGGQAAEVQGVAALAANGERAYFVASGDLLTLAQQAALAGAGRPLPQTGAENLYVYDGTPPGTLAFVADLCSGSGLSGGVPDALCSSGATASDQKLWELSGEAQVGGADGGFLVFATYAQLAHNDTDTAKDVYRYDAETGALERVSIGEEGHDANGNGSSFAAGIAGRETGETVRQEYQMENRAISEDGSRIIFESSEPLSPLAINGLTNVYEWDKQPGWSEGRVSLVSSGSASDPVEDAVITPEGNDIFFVTSQSLVAADTDSLDDVYDARLDGGFAAQPTPSQQCSSDACQGALTAPAPLVIPDSVAQEPGENVMPLSPTATGKKKAKRASTKKLRKNKARRGKRRKGGRAAHSGALRLANGGGR